MTITEVRIKLCEENNERLLAFCSVTFDNAFVVRDLKIIEGTRGTFVAMPSRKLTDRCPRCGGKNHLRAGFCNQCGGKLDETRAARFAENGRAKLHADIAHPIHAGSRELVQHAVVRAYGEERLKAMQPGYVCRYDDYDSDFEEADAAAYPAVAGAVTPDGVRHHAASAPRGPHLPQSVPVEVRRQAV